MTKDRFDNVCVRCEFPSSFDTDGRKRCIHCGSDAEQVLRIVKI